MTIVGSKYEVLFNALALAILSSGYQLITRIIKYHLVMGNLIMFISAIHAQCMLRPNTPMKQFMECLEKQRIMLYLTAAFMLPIAVMAPTKHEAYFRLLELCINPAINLLISGVAISWRG